MGSYTSSQERLSQEARRLRRDAQYLETLDPGASLSLGSRCLLRSPSAAQGNRFSVGVPNAISEVLLDTPLSGQPASARRSEMERPRLAAGEEARDEHRAEG